MDAIKPLLVGSGADLARVGTPGRDAATRVKPQESEKLAVSDDVQLSSRAQDRAAIRQDVTAQSESARGDARGQDEPTRSRMQGGVGDDEAQRLRELRQRDLQVRGGETVEAQATLQSLPTFEYDVGPDGRYYAVGDGVRLELPGVSEAESSVDVDSFDFAGSITAGAMTPAPTTTDANPAKLQLDAGDEGSESRSPAPEDEQKRKLADGAPSDRPPEPIRAAAAQERTLELDKSARAYQSAATMTATPGGVGTTIGTFEDVG